MLNTNYTQRSHQPNIEKELNTKYIEVKNTTALYVYQTQNNMHNTKIPYSTQTKEKQKNSTPKQYQAQKKTNNKSYKQHKQYTKH